MKKLLLLTALLLPLIGAAADSPAFSVRENGNTLLLTIDRRLLGEDVFFSSRVSRLSGHRNISAGQTFNKGKVIRFVEEGKLLLAYEPYSNYRIDTPQGQQITRGIADNSMASFSYVFDVQSADGRSLTIDVTKFFSEEIPGMLPLPGGFKEGRFEPRLSRIMGHAVHEDRVDVASRLVYTGADRNFSIEIGYNMLVMDRPMPVRVEDDRMGYMSTSYRTASDSDLIRSEKVITRWRIEPAPQDIARHQAGELVEPARPIVFYLDDALPERLRGPIRQGILDWNTAFEQIGFRNAVQVCQSTEGIDPMDVKINMVRYLPIPRPNAMGVTLVDPRSGEILQGDIYWMHNVEELLAQWRFVQTAAVDPTVRGPVMPASAMDEMVRQVAAHEMGHVLGLKHNMRGSYACPVDSLRSPAFTAQHGTTASIMDYARYNYVAQPGDLEKGVRLMPPVLGKYDLLTIQWGYSYFHGSRAEERSALEEMLTGVNDDPMLIFATTYSGAVSPDPSAQSDVLGDDVIRSSAYGIDNLKYIVSHLIEWSKTYGVSVELANLRYDSLCRQFFKYILNSASYPGGVYFYPSGVDLSQPRYVPVPAQKQREALRFVFAALKDYPQWLCRNDIDAYLGDKFDMLAKEQTSALGEMLTLILTRVSRSGEIPVVECLEIISEELFDGKAGKPLTELLRHDYIHALCRIGSAGKETGANSLILPAVNLHLDQLAEKWAKESRKNSDKSLYLRTLNNTFHEFKKSNPARAAGRHQSDTSPE